MFSIYFFWYRYSFLRILFTNLLVPLLVLHWMFRSISHQFTPEPFFTLQHSEVLQIHVTTYKWSLKWTYCMPSHVWACHGSVQIYFTTYLKCQREKKKSGREHNCMYLVALEKLAGLLPEITFLASRGLNGGPLRLGNTAVSLHLVYKGGKFSSPVFDKNKKQKTKKKKKETQHIAKSDVIRYSPHLLRELSLHPDWEQRQWGWLHGGKNDDSLSGKRKNKVWQVQNMCKIFIVKALLNYIILY